jgi:aminopeptidase
VLRDPRVDRMAKVLVEYSLGVRAGWLVTVAGSVAATPLIEAVCEHILRLGAHPTVLMDLPSLGDLLLREGSDEQLQFVNPYQALMVERADAVLRISSQVNTRSTNNIDPSRLALARKSQAPIADGYTRRIELNRPYSLTLFPTEAYAQDAEMSLSEFENFVFHACLLDGEEDPAERWRAVSREQQATVDWLAGRKSVHVESAGTDLTMSIEGRNFVNSDGKRNFPSGEVFTSPVEDSAQGHITFSYPASYNGRSVQGVKLVFKDGIVREYHAEAGEDFLRAMLDLDEGSRKLGEFAIGTNEGVTRITRNILFDEKIAGTIHCALGNAYPNAGGTNKSALHWDMVSDMHHGRIVVDGVTLYEDGKFVI